jgi:urease accessory protein
MFGAPSQSETSQMAATGLDGVRVAGGVHLRIASRDGRSAVADLGESDGYKVRFPRGGVCPEAVIINTGGGLAGGDRVRQEIAVGKGARATVTTQAAERVYRALGASETTLGIRLSLEDGARLDWLPQETILFDRARLQRSIAVDMAPSAQCLLVETLIFGRTAMGESVRVGHLRDRWRVRIGGKLVFAENLRLDGAIADTLSAAPIAGGAHVVATLVAVREDAADQLPAVRCALDGTECDAGASAWGNLLVVRALGRSGESVRRMLERVVPVLAGDTLPRVWQT